MNCRICENKSGFVFKAKILEKYLISYFCCPNCGFVQTEDPYWLEEAYRQPINDSDTGYVMRNINLSQKLCILLTTCFNKNANFLDYAGGYGVFVRLMRDIGFDFYWDDKFTQNLFAKGFEHRSGLIYEAVTTFECFEHFVDPMSEVSNLLSLSDTIIFSTTLLPDPLPMPEGWWYYGLEHGQHISFYSKRTFEFIADNFGLSYYNIGSLHIFSKKKISICKLKLTYFNKFGLHILNGKFMASKTWSDQALIIKTGKNEDRL